MDKVVKVLKGLGIAAACVVAFVLAFVFDLGNLKGLGDAAIQDAIADQVGEQLEGPAGDAIRNYKSPETTAPDTPKDADR